MTRTGSGHSFLHCSRSCVEQSSLLSHPQACLTTHRPFVHVGEILPESRQTPSSLLRAVVLCTCRDLWREGFHSLEAQPCRDTGLLGARGACFTAKQTTRLAQKSRLSGNTGVVASSFTSAPPGNSPDKLPSCQGAVPGRPCFFPPLADFWPGCQASPAAAEAFPPGPAAVRRLLREQQATFPHLFSE